MDRITRQRALLVTSIVALFVVLFILIAGMNSVHPLPGKRLPNLFAGVGDVSAGIVPGGPAWGANVVRILIQSLFALGAAVILLFVIISSRHRKQFVIILAILLALLVALAQVRNIPQGKRAPIPQRAAGGIIGAARPVEQVHPNIPPANPANWQVMLIAIGSAFVLTGIGLVLFLKIYPALRARSASEDDILDKLGKSAGYAAHRIIAGDDPRAAILRCYQEMAEILSQTKGVSNYSHFTPREFTAQLRTRGMKDEHVERLTNIFEAVRYGGRSGAGFLDEALSCLQSIQQAYAAQETG